MPKQDGRQSSRKQPYQNMNHNSWRAPDQQVVVAAKALWGASEEELDFGISRTAPTPVIDDNPQGPDDGKAVVRLGRAPGPNRSRPRAGNLKAMGL